MIEITKLYVRSFDLDRLDLFWEIAPLAGPEDEARSHEIFDYQFFILRSQAANGPYEQIGGPLRDIYHFRDWSVSLLNKYQDYFYKIRVLHVPTGETSESGITGSDVPEPDLIAAAIIREEDILFREFIGRRCLLFPVRTFGPRCSCFDITLGRKTRSAHLSCYGTGWLGGFMYPVECFVQIDPSPRASQYTSLMELQPNDTTARMICFPPIRKNDILIEPENKRWRVIQVSETQRLRSPVRQELTIHEIPKGDIEYSIPVNWDLKTFQASEERNFSNKTNIENDDYQDIFAAFGHSRGSFR